MLGLSSILMTFSSETCAANGSINKAGIWSSISDARSDPGDAEFSILPSNNEFSLVSSLRATILGLHVSCASKT